MGTRPRKVSCKLTTIEEIQMTDRYTVRNPTQQHDSIIVDPSYQVEEKGTDELESSKNLTRQLDHEIINVDQSNQEEGNAMPEDPFLDRNEDPNVANDGEGNSKFNKTCNRE